MISEREEEEEEEVIGRGQRKPLGREIEKAVEMEKSRTQRNVIFRLSFSLSSLSLIVEAVGECLERYLTDNESQDPASLMFSHHKLTF